MDRSTDSSEPLHTQVATRLRQEVRQGVYHTGQRLPAEVDLARQLGVSRGTVRQALTALLNEGLLNTVPGRGTFVGNGFGQRAVGLIGMILPSVVRARNPELIDGAEHVLREAGYSVVLGISGDDRWLEAEQMQRIIGERMAGYRWALGQYGLQYDADLVCTDVRRLLAWPPREPDKEQHNVQVLQAFLDRVDRPDAIFVCNDYVAFQVVQVAEALGLRIPDDLALVGFDSVAYTDYFRVPLTTVEQHRHEIGATAMSLLLDRIAGRRTQLGRVVIATRLVVRRSSGVPWVPELQKGEHAPWRRAASVS